MTARKQCGSSKTLDLGRHVLQGCRCPLLSVTAGWELAGIHVPELPLTVQRSGLVALGRRNWIDVGSKEAGPRVAAIISVVETCRRLKIPVRDYLGFVLPGLGDFPISRIAELTPAAWATRN